MSNSTQNDSGKRKPSQAQLAYWESLRGLKNENSPNWKGDKAGKAAVHNWLNANFGEPKICENPLCKGKSKWFDWAKKTDKEYGRSVDNFLRLCRSCHRQYDLTEAKKKKALNNLWWKTGTKPPGKLFKKDNKAAKKTLKEEIGISRAEIVR